MSQQYQRTATATTDQLGRCTFTFPPTAAQNLAVKGTVAVDGGQAGTFSAVDATGTKWGTWSGSQPFGPITVPANISVAVSATGLSPNTRYTAQITGEADFIENLDASIPTALGASSLVGTDAIVNLPVATVAALGALTPELKYYPCINFAALRLASVLASGGPVTIETKWWNADVTALMGYRRYVLGPSAPTLQVVIPHLGDQLEIAVTNQNAGAEFAYRDAVLALGPLLYWRLAELAGPTAADASGNARTGTYSTFGIGAAFTFAQLSPILSDPLDRSVLLVPGAAGDLAVNSAASVAFDTATVSLIGWVKPQSGSGTKHAIAGVMASNVSVRWYVRCQPNGTLEIFAGTSIVAGVSLPLDTWSFLAVTFDTADNKWRIYQNGVLTFTSGASSIAAVVNQPFVIGENGAGTGGEQLKGGVDEIALFAGVLTGPQILALYNLALAAPPPAAVLSLCATHTTQPLAMFGGLDIANATGTVIVNGTTATLLAPTYIFGGPALLYFNPSGASGGYTMRLQAQQPDGTWNDFIVRTNADGGRQTVSLFLPAQPIRLQATNSSGSDATFDAALMVDLHRVG